MTTPLTLAAQGFEPMSLPFWTSLMASGSGFVVFLFMTLVLVIHVAFALGVHRDAASQPGGPALVGPVIWALATLFGGVVTALIYWVMHHSAMRAPRE